MKKIFLTAIALLTMASTQVFGMYGAGSGWIDFLVNGNQFRARMGQLGFVLGNDTIRGTFGFVPNGADSYGQLLSSPDKVHYNFLPTISMGLGYTSSLISVGVGYNATISPNRWTKYNGKADGKTTEAVAHTPVLTLTALDNAFRMAIPIQVVHLADKLENGVKGNVTAVSFDAQLRYYTGIEALTQVRLYLKYGNYGYNYTVGGVNEKGKFAESFGFDLRFYFGSMVEEVALQPIVKLAYNGALGKQHTTTSVTAVGALNDAAKTINTFESNYDTNAAWKQGAWDLTIAPSLGLSAGSDVVSLYLEPSLGLKITQSGHATQKVKEVYSLAYGIYSEVYINPVKNLSWYFVVDIGNLGSSGSVNIADEGEDAKNKSVSVSSSKYLHFDASTGFTWFLPAL